MAEPHLANYANATLYSCRKNLFHVQKKLQSESTKYFQWFHHDYFKVNSGKSHVMLTADDSLQINV